MWASFINVAICGAEKGKRVIGAIFIYCFFAGLREWILLGLGGGSGDWVGVRRGNKICLLLSFSCHRKVIGVMSTIRL